MLTLVISSCLEFAMDNVDSLVFSAADETAEFSSINGKFVVPGITLVK